MGAWCGESVQHGSVETNMLTRELIPAEALLHLSQDVNIVTNIDEETGDGLTDGFAKHHRKLVVLNT